MTVSNRYMTDKRHLKKYTYSSLGIDEVIRKREVLERYKNIFLAKHSNYEIITSIVSNTADNKFELTISIERKD